METIKQDGLNALVTKRIQQKLAKGMSNVQLATQRMIEEGKIARDFVFEVGSVKKGRESNIIFHPDPVGRTGSTFYIPQSGPEDFTVNLHAVRQVAEKLRIPGVYITSLLMGQDWQKTLAYQILNTHNGWTDRNKVLVRAVGSEVRAFLSDSYRRLDSELIFGSHINEVVANGAQLSDGYMDDTRIMLESLLPTPINVTTQLNGIIFLAFGTRLATSDYGDGALDLRSFVMQGVCLNGMVRESMLRAVHLGAKLPDNIGLSQETYRLDSLTTSSAIKDITKRLYSSETIKTRMLEIKAASDLVTDPAQELKALFSSAKLMKGETEEIGQMLMRNNPEEGLFGESTLWKISQGITAYANREEVEPRRRMELQEIAGDLFKRVSHS